MEIQATLTFDGQCEEAFRFYESCLGGKIVFLMRYSEMPEGMGTGPEWDAKVAHASFAGEGFTFSGSDSPPGYYRKPQGMALQVNLKEIDVAERLWAALAEGGEAVSLERAHRFGRGRAIGCAVKVGHVHTGGRARQ